MNIERINAHPRSATILSTLRAVLFSLVFVCATGANASTLYVGKSDSSVVGVYDASAGGSFLRSFDIGYTGVDALAFGPNGNLHVGKTDESFIRVYDPVTENLVSSNITFAPGVDALALGPDGNLYSGRFGLDVVVVSTPGVGGGFQRAFNIEHPGSNALAFGPDGNLHVGDINNGEILVYDPATGSLLDSLIPFMGGIYALALGPDGNMYAGASAIAVMTPGVGGSFLRAFPIEQGFLVEALAFGPDGNLYIGSRFEDEILVYDLATENLVGTIATGLGGVDTMAFSAAVPIPPAAFLFGSAIGLLFWIRRRKDA